MKNIIKITVTATFFLTISNCCMAQVPQQNITNEIIGTWVLENDISYKISFNDLGERKEYNNNELLSTDIYSISHSCGSESDTKAWFLKITYTDDQDERCYELYGANADGNNILSIRDLISGKIFVFNKE